MLLRSVLLSGLVLVGSVLAVQAAGEPGVVAAINATPKHPRNSEGSFATLRSGRIIYYYSQFSEGDSDFSPCGIAQLTSDDGGRTWSEPRVVFTPEPGTMEMSVSLLRLASGRLACFTVIKRDKIDCRPYVRFSDDDGATWTTARRVVEAPGYFVLNNDRVIQTSTGRLIMPLGWHRLSPGAPNTYEGIDLRAVTLWYYSDDEGVTWKEADTWWALPAVTRTGLQEPGVVELADGSLLSWARTDQGCQYEFRSRDGGVTWSAPQPMALRSPAAPASIVRLPGSADLLAVYVDHSGRFPFVLSDRTYSNRTPLVAAVSSDGGVTWRATRVLGPDLQQDYCYAAIHFTGDAVLVGWLGVNRDAKAPHTMKLQRLKTSELSTPEDALSTQAKAVLRDVMRREESWIKIHAAEALVLGGDAPYVRQQLAALAEISTLQYRIGVQRVLARTSSTMTERDAHLAAVERIFLEPTSPDRSQALETLCKLRHRLRGPALAAARELAAGPDSSMRGLALWELVLADEPGARESLLALLGSSEPAARLIGAYACRLLGDPSPMTRAALARAAAQESPASRAYPYVLSAALALDADPAAAPAWRATLQGLLVAEATPDAVRFEICQGLLPKLAPADRAGFAPLLAHAGPDTRVGAALVILKLAGP